MSKDLTFSGLTFEENTRQPHDANYRPFAALVLHLQGYQKLEEETSRSLIFFQKDWMDSVPISSGNPYERHSSAHDSAT